MMNGDFEGVMGAFSYDFVEKLVLFGGLKINLNIVIKYCPI
jgi:hypothetical protein